MSLSEAPDGGTASACNRGSEYTERDIFGEISVSKFKTHYSPFNLFPSLHYYIYMHSLIYEYSEYYILTRKVFIMWCKYSALLFIGIRTHPK